MPEITYETISDHVRLLTMNRPETLNALTPEGNRVQREAIEEFRDDDDAWVLVITGAGERSFSTGLDLRARAQEDARAAEQGAPPPPPQIPSGTVHAYPSTEVWKPVIAAVNGYAFGGGLELALWCDIRILSENAEMGLLEPRRGLLSISGTTRLSRALPIGLAMEMILIGRRYKADELYRLGLANKVVPLPDLIPTAKEWADEIVRECSPIATRVAKEHVYRTLQMPVRDALQYQALMSDRLRLLAPEDTAEGPRAFTERRPPVWKAR